MPNARPLDPAEVKAAVRDLLALETGRVDDPHPIAEDRSGWHSMAPLTADEPGRPFYDPDSWRWFELVDQALVDAMLVVVFRWLDPATPDIRYLVLTHVDQIGSPEVAASVVRGQLRSLLEPGWRERVGRRWISHDKVEIWRQRPAGDERAVAKQRIRDDALQERWDSARLGGG